MGFTASRLSRRLAIRHVFRSCTLFPLWRWSTFSQIFRSWPPSPWKESELLAEIFYYLIRELRKPISFNLPRTFGSFFSLSFSLCLSSSLILFPVLFRHLPIRPAVFFFFFIVRVMLSLACKRAEICSRTSLARTQNAILRVSRDFNISTEYPIPLLFSCILYFPLEIEKERRKMFSLRIYT